MQCNQTFCGHGFNNAPLYSCNNTPLQCNACNMYSDIVGEGVVTTLTLPDGTMQLFFKPTLKWWTPNTFQQNIPNPMMQTSLNYNIPYINNPLGTWFVRSINNPLPPNLFSTSCQQFDPTKLCKSSECNLNACNIGYQLKFHNDRCTSTTDIQYFYPCLRQLEYTFKPTCRGTAAVQVETQPVENTVCHYEVRCNCHKPMSLASIAECKRKCISHAASPSSSCEDTRKKRNKRSKKHKSKSKNVTCACESTEDIPTADKSITTYSDIGSCCTAMNGCETQTTCQPPAKKQCCSKRIPMFLSESLVLRCDDKDTQSRHPVTPETPVSDRILRMKSVEKLFNFSDTEYNDDDSSSISSCCGS